MQLCREHAAGNPPPSPVAVGTRDCQGLKDLKCLKCLDAEMAMESFVLHVACWDRKCSFAGNTHDLMTVIINMINIRMLQAERIQDTLPT